MTNIKPIDTQIADLEAVIVGLEEDNAEHKSAIKDTNKLIKARRADIVTLLGQRGQSDLFEGGGD